MKNKIVEILNDNKWLVVLNIVGLIILVLILLATNTIGSEPDFNNIEGRYNVYDPEGSKWFIERYNKNWIGLQTCIEANSPKQTLKQVKKPIPKPNLILFPKEDICEDLLFKDPDRISTTIACTLIYKDTEEEFGSMPIMLSKNMFGLLNYTTPPNRDGNIIIFLFRNPVLEYSVRHEIFHYFLFAYFGEPDPGHENKLWEKCKVKKGYIEPKEF